MRRKLHPSVIFFCLLFAGMGFGLSTTLYTYGQDITTDEVAINGGLAWSPDGTMLAVGTREGVWIHDAHDLHVLGHFAENLQVTSLDWSSQTNQIVIGSENGDVELWEINSQHR